MGHALAVTGDRHNARVSRRTSLDAQGWYADDRVIKRLAGVHAGELFWCHVSGRALNPKQPHEASIWAFEDLSAR